MKNKKIKTILFDQGWTQLMDFKSPLFTKTSHGQTHIFTYTKSRYMLQMSGQDIQTNSVEKWNKELLLGIISSISPLNVVPQSIKTTGSSTVKQALLDPIKKDIVNTFEHELTNLINRHSMENESDTPDFILARFLITTMSNFNETTNTRSRYYNQ